jgi:hypothetical protein
MSRDDYRELVPIVDVAYQSRITEDQLRTLAATLPHAVSLAVECPDEPYDGDLRPGDVIIGVYLSLPIAGWAQTD